MDSSHQFSVPLRAGGKKIRKRRELDALIAHSFGKKRSIRRTTLNINSQEKLLSASTDDAEDYAWVQMNRPKNTHSICTNRCHNRKYMICKPLLVLIAIAVIIGLLYWMYLDLRQEMFVYRKKIEEVVVMNKDLPDILQKWHEVSTLLRKNQTTTNIRLNELERTTEKLRMNLTKYKSNLESQQNFAKEEKIVAAFGAKIEAAITDMESFKDYYSGVINKQIEMKTTLNDLRAKLIDEHARIVNVSELSTNFSKEMSAIKLYLRDDSTRIQDLWVELSQNLSLKWTALHANIQRNELQIAELMRRTENITLRIALMENNWEKNNIKIKDCQGLIHNIESNVTDLKTNSEILKQSISTICNHFIQNNKLQDDGEEYKQNTTVIRIKN
ncbi:uncharacterized protein LOC120771941 isoform X1 [Bactrocera tryoni]|uniref:uncharacterized protein LOC120771941 isoform X1 n=1 Tax=Bactrocera tryoni TaxID=59916 RepID=UPI001A95EF81|nr:uncharacterized protein LOC120771941 isoform X1 [Bactrocera tryoni]